MSTVHSFGLHTCASLVATSALLLAGCAAVDSADDDGDDAEAEAVAQSADELRGGCPTPKQTRTVVDKRCSTRSTYRCNLHRQWVFVGCAQPSSAGGGCWHQGRVVPRGFMYTVDHSLTCDSSVLLTCVGGGQWREDYCSKPAR